MKSEIKSGAILGYINIISTILVTILYTPIMLKLVGQSEYGLYTIVTSVIAYLSVLDMGFGNAMIRFVSKSQAQNTDINNINGMFLLFYCVIGIIALIIGTVISSNLGLLFDVTFSIAELQKAKIIMLILVFTIAVSFPLSIFDSYAVACEKFKFLKIIAIVKTLIIPLLTLPLLLLGYKSIAMVIVTSSVQIVLHIITLIYCFKNLDMHINFKIKDFDKGLIKEIFIYSSFIFLNLLVDQVFNNTDQVILGAVCGTVVVSIYAVAHQINLMNIQFSTVISGLFLPKITKTLEKEKSIEKVSDLFIKVSRIQLYILLLILTGFIIFGKLFLNLWVGNEFMDAYYIILLLIGPSIIPLTQNIGISIIQAMNKHKFRSIVYLIIAIINILISIPLSKALGGIGAAIGTAIANILGQILTMNLYYWKKVGINIPKYWNFFLKISIPIIFISIILSRYIKYLPISWITLIICGLIYIIFYFVYILFFVNDYEKEYIKKILNLNNK